MHSRTLTLSNAVAGMIKRLIIKDYMAHKETELELDPGVTVLTGPNNSGKSAVVEALRSVAQNPPPHHVIRHGASQAVVRVELESGEAVEWVRSRGNTIYRVSQGGRDDNEAGDGSEVYAKFGRTPPEDVRRLLRLDLVETESGSVDIHIGNQRYPVFLLDQTGSQAASFFAASTEAEYLLRMQQVLKSKTDRTKSRRKEILQECSDLEQALDLYEPLANLDSALSGAEALHSQLIALQKILPLQEQVIKVLEATDRQHAGKVKLAQVFELLAIPPQVHETKGLGLVVEDQESILLDSRKVEANLEALTSLSVPPVLQDTSPLDALIRACENNRIALSSRCLKETALQALGPPPALHEIEKLDQVLRSLHRTECHLSHSAASGEVLEVILPPPELRPAEPLHDLIEQLTAADRSAALFTTIGESLEKVKAPPEPHHSRSLEESVVSLDGVQKRLQETHRRSDILLELISTPEPQPVAGGDDILERLTAGIRRLEANARLREDLVVSMASKRLEIEEVIEDLGLCPLCGQILDVAHFLEEAHG